MFILSFNPLGYVATRPKKLCTKFVGPFPIIGKFEEVAYTMCVPPKSIPSYMQCTFIMVHFLVLLLYEFILLLMIHAKILEVRIVKNHNTIHVECIVERQDHIVKCAKWEFVVFIIEQFLKLYPDPRGQGSS